MDRFSQLFAFIVVSVTFVSCRGTGSSVHDLDSRYASGFSVSDCIDGSRMITVISPYDGSSDTLYVSHPLKSIVCLSSTSVAGFSLISSPEVVSGVSGMGYISDPYIRSHEGSIVDVGYDPELDLEAIVRLHPDVVLGYSTSAVEPAYVSRLESLGIKVLMLYDYLEEHPLARAEYIRLYGAMVGKSAEADSLFADIAGRYESIASMVSAVEKPGVLMNLPYAGVWYVPGKDNYMSRLVSDAGAYIIGSEDGTGSSTISLEKALEYSTGAGIWLNPGWCTTRDEIAAVHPIIAEFPVLKSGAIFNNIKRTTPAGGNDFWESGSVRPDLVLQDLVKMIHPELSAPDDSLEYYIVVQ